MQAGKLRHLLTIQEKTETNTLGSVTPNWSTLATAYGAFEPLGSREFPSAEKRHAEAQARFRIRYMAGLDAGEHRILFELEPGTVRTFDIFPPLPVDGKRAELHIEAVEVV